jgi:hypothetical protein
MIDWNSLSRKDYKRLPDKEAAQRLHCVVGTVTLHRLQLGIYHYYKPGKSGGTEKEFRRKYRAFKKRGTK